MPIFTEKELDVLASQRDEAKRLAEHKEPMRTASAEVRSVVAYATTDGPNRDEKAIYIPEGWAYFTHSCTELSRHNGDGNCRMSDWVVRDPTNPSRIIEVRLKVEVGSFMARAWLGVRLDVTIVPLP